MASPTMHPKEQIEMMRRCAEEIKTLRGAIAELQPKAEAYEQLKRVLDLLPRPSQGYGEDLVWTLNNRISEIETELKAEKPGDPTDNG